MTTAARTTTDRRSITDWRSLQAIWTLGLILSIVVPPMSLIACLGATLAYRGSRAWRLMRWVVLGVALVDVLILIALR